MKSAEQWLADKQFCRRETPNIGSFTAYGVEAIQADARAELEARIAELEATLRTKPAITFDEADRVEEN